MDAQRALADGSRISAFLNAGAALASQSSIAWPSVSERAAAEEARTPPCARAGIIPFGERATGVLRPSGAL